VPVDPNMTVNARQILSFSTFTPNCLGPLTGTGTHISGRHMENSPCAAPDISRCCGTGDWYFGSRGRVFRLEQRRPAHHDVTVFVKCFAWTFVTTDSFVLAGSS
jgi:hypothetical protein